MARDTLIFLNYQREIPPFMISQLEYASKYFDRVYYVTRTLENDNRDQVRAGNVEFVDAGHFGASPAALWRMRGVLANGGGDDLRRALSARALTAGLVRSSLVGEFASTLLYEAAEHIITGLDDDRVAVFSVWFLTEALAAARLKLAHPSIRAVSFAHSFEVQDSKNPYIDYQRTAFRHSSIDEIHFISRMVLEDYASAHAAPLRINLDNADVVYLGSPRPLAPSAGPTAEGPLHIVSCSGVTEVKRLSLLVDALADLQTRGLSFRWTHLGGGPLEEDVRELAAKKLPAASFEMTGRLTNREVHEYYRDNAVDLFVNVSSMEGLPVSIMEAISYGIPAVATDVGGNAEIVRDGETGFLLGSDPTPREVADAIVRFLALGSEELLALRERCRDLWTREFDAERNAGALYGNLREI